MLALEVTVGDRLSDGEMLAATDVDGEVDSLALELSVELSEGELLCEIVMLAMELSEGELLCEIVMLALAVMVGEKDGAVGGK